MRRALLVLVASLLVTPAAQSSVGAQENPPPVITLMEWKEPPVTTTTGQCDSDGMCDEETLIIEAHDPDSSISEIQVWFDEGGERAPIVFAHTYCVQGIEPGTVAHLEIPATFTEPGDYVVAAVAYSHFECIGHEEGDVHEEQHSDIARLETKVRKPLRILLDTPLTEGGRTRVRLQNRGRVTYTYNAAYEACDMRYRTASGRRFIIPEGTHCDIILKEELGPGETVTLFKWDLDECVKDSWGCVKARDLPPGGYSMRGWFQPLGGGDELTVNKSFRIRHD